jgi:hypothetical protein
LVDYGIPTGTEDVAMGIVTTLVLALGGDSGAPVGGVLPEPVAIRIRMLGLREGMSATEVQNRLGLNGHAPDYFASTVSNSTTVYSVGQTHRFRLDYSLIPGPGISHGLNKAVLEAKPAK